MRTNCAKAVVLVACLAGLHAWAQLPQQLAFQGRLMKADGTPERGIVSIGFALFGVETGGIAVWSEAQAVALSDGFYSVLLGATTPFPRATFGGDLWLELTVGGTAMAPRQRVVSVPYAMTAGTAQMAQGAQTAINVSGGAVEAVAPASFAGMGTVTAVGSDVTALSTLISGSDKTGFRSQVGPGDVIVVNNDSALMRRVVSVTGDSELLVDAPFPAGGFANKPYSIQKLTVQARGSTGNAQLVVNANGEVGVGTATPRQRLHVAGRVEIEGSDLQLGTRDGRTVGQAPHQRALVHYNKANGGTKDDQLGINVGSDFEGGTLVQSDLEVTGKISSGLQLVQISPTSTMFDYTCPTGSYVVSGGAWASIGEHLRESVPISETTWRVSCQKSDGADTACAGMRVLCSRLAP